MEQSTMRMKKLGLALTMCGIMTAAANAQAVSPGGGHDVVPTGKGGWNLPAAPDLEKRGTPKPPPPPAANNGINYHNGPVMLGTVNIYYIWYGDWSTNSGVDILTNLAESIGGTPWYNINTSYYSGSGRQLKHVSNSVAYKGSTTDDYSHGKSLSDDDVRNIVADALTSGRLPKDTNGVYFVLTSADVSEVSGFCSNYCGWHTYDKINGSNIKFAFIGNPDQCPSACTRLRYHSPNDNIGADGMASIIAHELSESVTDPQLNAWYSGKGDENADKCAFTFGTLYTAPNGAGANVQMGTRDYLLQQNWVNAGGGYCGLSYP
jgi:Phosphate-induced protein 1 conserved region